MDHLKEIEMTYFEHLYRAWKVAAVLIIHGLFPNIWKNKASQLLAEH